jgi:hypothetical protein
MDGRPGANRCVCPSDDPGDRCGSSPASLLVEQRSPFRHDEHHFRRAYLRDDIRRALLRANRMDMHCVHSTNGRRQRLD